MRILELRKLAGDGWDFRVMGHRIACCSWCPFFGAELRIVSVHVPWSWRKANDGSMPCGRELLSLCIEWKPL